MTALVPVTNDALNTKIQIEQTIALVRQTTSKNDVMTANRRVKLAREWAKLHGVIEQSQRDLMRLEIACLQRLAELDALDMLPNRSKDKHSAKFFQGKTNDEIDEIISRHPDAKTACTLYIRESGFVEIRQAARHSARNADGADAVSRRDKASRRGATEATTARQKINAAATTLLHELVTDGRTFTVPEMAQELIERLELQADDPVLRDPVWQGVSDVCRAAVQFSLVDEAPRFITVPIEGRFLRIPTEHATIEQFQAMIDFREEQLRQDQAALDKLKRSMVIILKDKATLGDQAPRTIGEIRAAYLDLQPDRTIAQIFTDIGRSPLPDVE